jgi:uncharacterized protein YbaR (Trm112 family)
MVGWMIDPELLALLVCPETHQDVVLATAAEVTGMNEAITQRRLLTVAGVVVEESIDGALVRADGVVAYPIRDGIPVMLSAEGFALAGLAAQVATHG